VLMSTLTPPSLHREPPVEWVGQPA
jgi:hypothetical protein